MTQTINSTTTLTILPKFCHFTLAGADSVKFLQGQVTCNVNKLDDMDDYQATAISNLRGRIQFGIWLKKQGDSFDVVISEDCAEAFSAHVKKFGAFSKFTLSEVGEIYPCVLNDSPTFSNDSSFDEDNQQQAWAKLSLATGNYWITTDTTELYQPQELRLHQRGGVDYNKGCYLGQEVIARIYFRSTPKAFLHRIAGTGATPKAGDSIGEKGKAKVVNAVQMTEQPTEDSERFEALVVARPESLAEFEILELPTALQGGVGREVS